MAFYKECARLATQLLHAEHPNGRGGVNPFQLCFSAHCAKYIEKKDSLKCCQSPDFHKDIALLCPNVPDVPKVPNGHDIPWFQDVCDLIGHRQKAPSRSRLCQHGTWDKNEKGFVGIWMWMILAWTQEFPNMMNDLNGYNGYRARSKHAIVFWALVFLSHDDVVPMI